MKVFKLPSRLLLETQRRHKDDLFNIPANVAQLLRDKMEKKRVVLILKI